MTDYTNIDKLLYFLISKTYIKLSQLDTISKD